MELNSCYEGIAAAPFDDANEPLQIDSLPDELFISFFSFLNFESLCQAGAVCKRWRLLSLEKSLLSQLFFATLRDSSGFYRTSLKKRNEASRQSKGKRRKIDEEAFFLRSLESHACMGSKKVTPTLKVIEEMAVYESHFLPRSFQVNEGKLYSGTDQNAIKVTDIDTYEVIETFEGLSAPSHSLQISKDRLYVHSLDNMISILDLLSGKIIQTLSFKHNFETFQVSDGFFFKSFGNSISMIDIETEKTVQIFRGNSICFHASQGCLYSGSLGGTIRMWALNSDAVPKLIKIHQTAVHHIQAQEGLIYSSGADNRIKIWDVQANQEKLSFVASDDTPISCFQVFDSYIFSGSKKELCIFDEANGEKKCFFEGHTGRMHSIEVYRGKVFMKDDASIRILDFNNPHAI